MPVPDSVQHEGLRTLIGSMTAIEARERPTCREALAELQRIYGELAARGEVAEFLMPVWGVTTKAHSLKGAEAEHAGEKGRDAGGEFCRGAAPQRAAAPPAAAPAAPAPAPAGQHGTPSPVHSHPAKAQQASLTPSRQDAVRLTLVCCSLYQQFLSVVPIRTLLYGRQRVGMRPAAIMGSKHYSVDFPSRAYLTSHHTALGGSSTTSQRSLWY